MFASIGWVAATSCWWRIILWSFLQGFPSILGLVSRTWLDSAYSCGDSLVLVYFHICVYLYFFSIIFNIRCFASQNKDVKTCVTQRRVCMHMHLLKHGLWEGRNIKSLQMMMVLSALNPCGCTSILIVLSWRRAEVVKLHKPVWQLQNTVEVVEFRKGFIWILWDIWNFFLW